MVTKRIGNDVRLEWELKYVNGDPEDLLDVDNLKVEVRHSTSGKKYEQKNFTLKGDNNNIIKLDFIASEQMEIGIYEVFTSYLRNDSSIKGGIATSAWDKCNVFKLVEKSCDLPTDDGDITIVTIIEKGIQGDMPQHEWDGTQIRFEKPDKTWDEWVDLAGTGIQKIEEISVEDKEHTIRITKTDGTFDDFLIKDAKEVKEIEIDGDDIKITYDNNSLYTLKNALKGINQAAESALIVENQISINEQGRVLAENERETAEATRLSNENNRVTSEQERAQAESLRVTAETSRETAEGLRVDAELLRQTNTQTAITNAEEATENANTAAQNADDARLAIRDDLDLKANHGYSEGEEPKTLKEVEDNASVKIENLIKNGDFRNGLSVFNMLRIGANPRVNEEGYLVIDGYGALNSNHGYQGINISTDFVGDIFYFHLNGRVTEDSTILYMAMSLSSRYLVRIESAEFISISMTHPLRTVFGATGVGIQSIGGTSIIKNIMAINLTQAFGAGNEPTKEEMDLLISTLGIDYFEGEITIPAQKIMQWQLAAIKNKANKVPEDWQSLTLLNGSTGWAKFRKDDFGTVWVVGEVVKGTNPRMFALPAGYRPLYSFGVVLAHSGLWQKSNFIYAQVNTSGSLQAWKETEGDIIKINIQFPTNVEGQL